MKEEVRRKKEEGKSVGNLNPRPLPTTNLRFGGRLESVWLEGAKTSSFVKYRFNLNFQALEPKRSESVL
ncbi:MAG: hypothetical protein KME60_16920 [Cyanomargarita calcarea GSE-NOS-MK-12-04C]|jgi:hypothetical protein|uniref:Uncharacterized protein n=1 Tax=Cyanomargarita calcarea GSE-NOS-MK-12-04C TaxID=2839659 RepID=A0A951QML0_9CYAN|nr:hypothetical protein [Cyanomargarita calcarea GSE-NOS-MK-12-04C]